MAEEYAELAACDGRGYLFASLSPQEEPVRLWVMEEAKAATPGIGAVGDTSGCSALSILMERLFPASAQSQERRRKEKERGILAIL